uniref:Uncharacterized protein AlNc14C52G4061 n=1 Tax=Albugo laibachii Nc14 TaxID=890382 RepID=F0WBL6_9STRA|nr:conserved hypothetical protein [Albugo laibachii Nc14]|eukprot:CCA18543.1 conserved hypothetical protein [Albugo laibachii Nc14]
MTFAAWPLGLILSACSSIFGIMGKLLLKLAHNQREFEEYEKETNQTNQTNQTMKPKWVHANGWCVYFCAGLFAMVVLNPLLASLAYCFASQSLLAPMGGLAIGWNTALGPLVLPHEQLAKNDLIGALLIFSGCILVGVSGTHSTINIPIHEMSSRFHSVPFIMYIVMVSVFLVVLAYNARGPLWKANDPAKAEQGKVLPTTESSDFECDLISESTQRGKTADTDAMSLEESNTPLLKHPKKPLDFSRTSRISISILSGVVSGQLFFLAALMRVLHDESGYHIWHFPVTYVCLIGSIVGALSGLYLLNVALQVDDAVMVIYLYEASYIIAGAISGLCFFQDMKHMPMWHYVVYSLSLCLIMGGIYVVAQRKDQDEEETNFLLPLLVAPAAVQTHPSSRVLFRRTSSYHIFRHSASPRHHLSRKSCKDDTLRRKSFPYATVQV